MSLDPPRLSGFRTDSDSDFAFAFNDANFSDRLLRIEIVPDLCKSDEAAEVGPNRKRRREEIIMSQVDGN